MIWVHVHRAKASACSRCGLKHEGVGQKSIIYMYVIPLSRKATIGYARTHARTHKHTYYITIIISSWHQPLGGNNYVQINYLHFPWSSCSFRCTPPGNGMFSLFCIIYLAQSWSEFVARYILVQLAFSLHVQTTGVCSWLSSAKLFEYLLHAVHNAHTYMYNVHVVW